MTILKLQSRMESGAPTCRGLAVNYLDRIAELDKQGPAVNAVIELNPDAPGIADVLDHERATRNRR